MLQVKKDPVHLVKVTLFVMVLDSQLVAVGLADGAVLPCPFVPDMAAQVADAVGLLLPDPQQLVHGALPVGAAEGHNGEFFRQVVAVHHAEGLDGMGRRAVCPVGADFQALVGNAFLQNFSAGRLVYFICIAHVGFLRFDFELS